VLGRAGVSVRGILDWPIMEGRIITAGILGVFPSSRFLLITPALAENMSDDELAAVVAHEAGHVRHRHMLQYLLFFLGFFVLSYFLAGPLSLALGSFLYLVAGSAWGVELITSPDNSAALDLFMALPLVFLMILYLRFVMGYFMRHFERQADLFTLKLTGTSLHLAGALEKVASLSGNIRDVPSWHHFSVAQRVEHLLNAQVDKSLIKAESRRISKGFLIYAFCLGLLIAVSLGLGHTGIANGLEKNITLKVMEQKLAGQSLTPAMIMELGILRFEAGHEAQGISDLERTLANNPKNPELLNTLAWFLVTARDRELRQPARALRLAEKAVTRSPKPHIWDTYAEALYVNRDYERAVAAARSALQAGPKKRVRYYKDQLRRFENALADR
jgi:tetratricopeptide (TPR) repeat protein